MVFRNLFACLLAAAAATARAEPNVITAVEVKDEGAAVTIEIRGSKAPNFTSFSMADPPRFVIDLSESTFDGVPEDLVVDDGLVKVVKNLSYGSGPTAIARVLVAFTRDVDPPEVKAVGGSLLVRVAKPEAAGMVAATSAPVDAAQAAADAQAEERARAEAAARAEADARAKAEAEARAKADAARAEEARLAAAAVAALAAEPAPPVAAPAEGSSVEATAARAEPVPEAAPVADVSPVAEAAPADVAPVPDVAAFPEPAAAAVAAAPIETLAPAAPRAVVREIGFRQLSTGSRVYVRTSVPPRFTIHDAGGDVVRLELENTRVTRRNDLRFLDTSFFPSAVAMVTPARQGTSYVVEIKLRERVPYQQKIEGDVLAIDFERPASAGPAAPAAPPPGNAVDSVAPDDAVEAVAPAGE